MTRPNGAANDPHVDLEVLLGGVRVNNAQVGVGQPAYLRRKAQRSQAAQVVINHETREYFRARNDETFSLTDDRLRHRDTSSQRLSGSRVEQEAAEILAAAISGQPAVTSAFRLRTSVRAGGEAFIFGFGRSLLLGAVHRLYHDQELDESLVNEALTHGVDSLVKTGLHTHLLTSEFLQRAGELFDAKLIHRLGTRTVVAGAIAEVVVETVFLVFACLRKEITFEQLLRRFGVVVFSAGGAAAGGLAALYVTRGMPAWVTIGASILAAWGGGKFGHILGEALFEP